MRIAIVEDYPPVAKSLARMTETLLGRRVDSLNVFPSVTAFIDHLDEHSIDLLLLDLNLGGCDGFEILKRCVAQSFFTIVVSANTQRALEAFEYGVIDFVGKPVNRDRLKKAFDRLDGGSAEEHPALGYLAVRSRQGFELIHVDEVHFIKGASKYSELRLADGRSELHDKNLERLQILLPSHFRRVHKSFVVNMREARRLIVRPGGSYELELASGETVPVGRARYKGLREEMV